MSALDPWDWLVLVVGGSSTSPGVLRVFEALSEHWALSGDVVWPKTKRELHAFVVEEYRVRGKAQREWYETNRPRVLWDDKPAFCMLLGMDLARNHAFLHILARCYKISAALHVPTLHANPEAKSYCCSAIVLLPFPQRHKDLAELLCKRPDVLRKVESCVARKPQHSVLISSRNRRTFTSIGTFTDLNHDYLEICCFQSFDQRCQSPIKTSSSRFQFLVAVCDCNI